MKKLILCLSITFSGGVNSHNSIFAQVNQEWISIFNGPSNRADEPTSMAIDIAGNVYVTGSTSTISFLGASDFATIKYNSSGVQQWVAYYNGPASADSSRDYANSIALDNTGNVYVVGTSYGGATNFDYVTIKYSSNGIQRWAERFNSTTNSYDEAIGIAVDNSGKIYVTGTSPGDGSVSEFTTIKYDSSGMQQWVAGYKGMGDMSSSPTSIKLDLSGNVYVTGSSNHLGSSDNYATVKYNPAGVQQWAVPYYGASNFQDNAYSIAVDNSGNVYVTGASWGSVTNLDYATIKYNSSGFQQWAVRYNGSGSSTDVANTVAVDILGNVFVTGYSLGTGTSYDYATIKYNSNGDSVWVRRYDYGPGGNRDDRAFDLALDSTGNVYVTGWSSSSMFNDYTTIKYSSTGNQLWLQRYNGVGNYNDAAVAVAIDNSENVYVTGASWGDSSNTDYATIKYSHLVSVNQITNSIPKNYFLYQNYPNPFNPVTVISYQLAVNSNTSLKIYDILGNEVSTLVNEKQNAGVYSINWNASSFPSGIYYYKIISEKFSDTKKMSLIK